MLTIGTILPFVPLATVVVPVAVYFLVLGLLNSRRTPQLLSARVDFAILLGALSPLLVIPALQYVTASPAALALAAGAAAAAVGLLLPRGSGWVVYNIPHDLARRLVREALAELAIPQEETDDGFALADGAAVRLNAFPLLRNVSIRLTGPVGDLPHRLPHALALRLADTPVEASPMAVSLLLVATGMLVAPLALLAQRAPEIVRLLTQLLP